MALDPLNSSNLEQLALKGLTEVKQTKHRKMNAGSSLLQEFQTNNNFLYKQGFI